MMNVNQKLAVKVAEQALTHKGEEVKSLDVTELDECNCVMVCMTIGSIDDEDSIRSYLFYIGKRGGVYYITKDFKVRYIKKYQINKFCCISD